jgi:hypothetical protein
MRTILWGIGLLLAVGCWTRQADAAVIVNAPKSLGLSQGLVGHWTFDGKTVVGTRAYDQSGQGNYGTLTGSNGLPTRTIGKLGQGLQFDGVDDYVSTGVTSLLNIDRKTVSAWVLARSLGAGGDGTIVTNDASITAGIQNGWAFYVGGSGGRRLGYLHDFSAAGADGEFEVAGSALTLGVWHHVVVTYDRTSAANDPVFYIDGVKQGTPSDLQGTAGTAANETATNAQIGTFNEGTSDYFDGTIDDVHIYNRALSADEIKRLYKIGGTFKANTTLDGPQNGLVGWWTFDGKHMSGNRAFDASGQGNYGTLTGSNGLPVRTIGKIGQGLSFDGVDDYVELGTPSIIRITGSITLSAWIKASTLTGTDRRIITKGSPGGQGFSYGIDITNDNGSYQALMVLTSSGADYFGRYSATTISTGQWYHVVGVYNAANQTVDLYLNGALDNGIKLGTIQSSINDSSGDPFRIGTDSQGIMSDYWNGLIDDVRVYNRDLTRDEIKRLYNSGR